MQIVKEREEQKSEIKEDKNMIFFVKSKGMRWWNPMTAATEQRQKANKKEQTKELLTEEGKILLNNILLTIIDLRFIISFNYLLCIIHMLEYCNVHKKANMSLYIHTRHITTIHIWIKVKHV